MKLKYYFLPHALVLWHRKHHGKSEYRGDYQNWDDAVKNSGGYDAANIIEAVRSATQAVIDGRAVFERDSVLFHQEDYNWPLLSGLLASIGRNPELHVLDFGGALGSMFWQNWKILAAHTENLVWHVVEQPAMLEAAEKLNYDALLFFHSSIDAAYKADPQINTVLFGSVLQYLPNWEQIVQAAINRRPEVILLDRTPVFADFAHRRCSVQTVPPEIYDASYPLWIFGKNELPDAFKEHYDCQWDYTSPISGSTQWIDGKKINSSGFYFKRRK